MKVYVTSRYKNAAENKDEIESLCKAVRDAGLIDFSFIRDVEHYQKKFDDPKGLWERAYDELRTCEMVLIDVSDNPTGGRIVEAGMAFALRKPVVMVKKQGVKHKDLFDGIADTIIEYKDYADLSEQLKQYDDDRNFNVAEKLTVLLTFLLPGLVIGWFFGQLYIPLGYITPVVYWLIARWLFKPLQRYDRIVIYVPLIAIWAVGFYLLAPIYLPLGLAWLVGFWLVTLVALDKLKLSL
jgi:nucleoside 2-deoxyribosyltransferase